MQDRSKFFEGDYTFIKGFHFIKGARSYSSYYTPEQKELLKQKGIVFITRKEVK